MKGTPAAREFQNGILADCDIEVNVHIFSPLPGGFLAQTFFYKVGNKARDGSLSPPVIATRSTRILILEPFAAILFLTNLEGCNDGGMGGVLPLLQSGKIKELEQHESPWGGTPLF